MSQASTSQIPSEKQRRWALIVAEHTASFNEVIRLAGQWPHDRALRDLGGRAEAGLRQLNKASRDPHFSASPHGFGSIGQWGENGHAAKIRFMLSSARNRVAVLASKQVEAA